MKVMIRDREFEVSEEPKDFWGWVGEGRYDREWKAMDEFLTPDHTFIDLGAWVGSHSLYASRIAKRVIAVEPDPIAGAVLKKNISYCPMIEFFDCAVTGNKGLVMMGSGFLGASTTRINPHAGGGIGPWEPGQTFSTYSTTIRHLVTKHNVDDPMFIKMDVEGSEEDILCDVDFFREHKPVLFLEQHPWWWRDKDKTRKLIEDICRICKVIL